VTPQRFQIYHYELVIIRGVVGVDGGGQRPHTSLHKMIRYVRFMYVCDLARVWRPPTSYGVHGPHTSYFRTTPLVIVCVIYKAVIRDLIRYTWTL